jgi:hypothetical protein
LFEFYWREPITFLEDTVSDPSLMQHSNFHPVRKFMVDPHSDVCIIDEPCTANAWWRIEVCVTSLDTQELADHN